MSTPQRIQLRRTRGWRKPEGAIVVARPSKWGNPFHVDGSVIVTTQYKPNEEPIRQVITHLSARQAVALFELWLTNWHVADIGRRIPIEAIEELRGHDLACWCPLDQPCHADVLLKLANETTRREA